MLILVTNIQQNTASKENLANIKALEKISKRKSDFPGNTA
jgi:hypothetical protein